MISSQNAQISYNVLVGQPKITNSHDDIIKKRLNAKKLVLDIELIAFRRFSIITSKPYNQKCPNLF